MGDLHYHPPWYPDRGPGHNPWAVADNMTGKTHYAQFCDEIGPEELQRRIKAYRATCCVDCGEPLEERRSLRECVNPACAMSVVRGG